MLATFTVTSAGDDVDAGDGVVTLREAILDSNTNSGADTITFHIAGGGDQTITLGGTNLPTISDPVTIDGSTQPGYSGTALITIDATTTTTYEVMRVWTGGDGTTLRDFNIANASNVAILVSGGSANTLIEHVNVSWSGTNRAGTGIRISGSDANTIRDVAATNRGTAVLLHDASNNLIENSNLSGSGEGVRLQQSSGGNTIQGNDASGTNAGIRDYYGTGSNNRYLNNNLSDVAWVAITIEGNDNPFEIAGNVFVNSTAVQLKDFSDISLTAGPTFDIDVTDARGGIILNSATNVTLDGFDVSGSNAGGYDRGIGIHSASTNVTLRNIVARDRDFAILTVGLTDSLIENVDATSTVPADSAVGLQINGGSGNTIRGVVSTNRGAGIQLKSSHNNLIEDNTLGDGMRWGVTVGSSNNNTLRNNDVSNSSRAGVELYGTSSDNAIHCSTISNNSIGIHAQAAVTGLVVSDNDISGNGTGIKNLSGDPINAENNYWGAADGPSSLGGSGDSYSGNVDASPYLTALPACLNPVQSIHVDVKPGNSQNQVNAKSRGVIPVAIYTTADFVAATVDTSTIRLAGVEADHFALGDVDGDGDLDLILHFAVQDLLTALALDLGSGDEESVEVKLTGETIDDVLIEGSDTINFFLRGKGKGKN